MSAHHRFASGLKPDGGFSVFFMGIFHSAFVSMARRGRGRRRGLSPTGYRVPPAKADAWRSAIFLRKHGLATGVSTEVNGLCVHSLRATVATKVLAHESDIAKVQ
jgi:hypothetical protein